MFCPVCHNKYPVHKIEKHASICAEKFDQQLVSYSDDDCDSNHTDVDKTLPYLEDLTSHPSKEVAIRDRVSTMTKLNEIQDITNSEIFKCRRQFAWQDFVQHTRKPWSHPNNTLKATFLKESAVDTGGPRREFFSGKYLRLLASFWCYNSY